MQNLKVSIVQTQQFWEDKEKNLKHFEKLLEEQLLEETDVIVFPEMFHTGFSMNVTSLAETIENSDGISWLQQIALSRDALCLASLIIEENNQYFNRMVAVHPDGKVLHYDKIHLFSLAHEDQYYSPGKKRTIVHFKDWKILLQICYDLRFPENARNSIIPSGEFEFDVIIYVANWPERRIVHWDKLLAARAIENQCYVVALNRVGTDNNRLTYNGSSQIITAMGTYEIEPMLELEQVRTTQLSMSSLAEVRTNLAFLKDRQRYLTF
jgi:predicted amidohydrolase